MAKRLTSRTKPTDLNDAESAEPKKTQKPAVAPVQEEEVLKRYPIFSARDMKLEKDAPKNIGMPLGDGTEKIISHRFRDEYSLMGSPIVVLPFDDIVDSLAQSGFMDTWIREQIGAALRAGMEFSYRSVTMNTPKATYRMCTDQDIRALAESGELARAMTRPGQMDERTGGAKSKASGPRKSRSCYRLPPVTTGETALVEGLQKGGRTIFLIMRKHVGDNGGEITGNELRMLLDGKKTAGELKTTMDVMKLFGFHMSQFFRKTEPPLVEYVEAEEDGDEEGQEDE